MADKKEKTSKKEEEKPSSAKVAEGKEKEQGVKKGTAKEAEEKEKEKDATQELPSKLQKIAKKIEGLTALELSELGVYLEDKFGVTAAPAVAPQSAPQTQDEVKEAEEKSFYNVVLTDAGSNKLSVIKAVRQIDQSLGLMDAKKLVESAPKEILKEAKKEDAEEAKKKIEDAGGKAELK